MITASAGWNPGGVWRNGARVAGCGLRVAGCRLRVAGCGLQVAGCRLQVAGCRLRVAGCGLSPSPTHRKTHAATVLSKVEGLKGRPHNSPGRSVFCVGLGGRSKTAAALKGRYNSRSCNLLRPFRASEFRPDLLTQAYAENASAWALMLSAFQAFDVFNTRCVCSVTR
ncbi:MAG: hypothetical protein EHM23_22955 [Acidobacteria bacterium]|nr:MAG: hypothetical protein EHM23_22955 [Acidobacteriota bacterium]